MKRAHTTLSLPSSPRYEKERRSAPLEPVQTALEWSALTWARRKGISQITEPLGKPGRLEEKEECEVLLCKGDEREERK